jgi:two-component system, chemotaxis family, sensor kinase Cph1
MNQPSFPDCKTAELHKINKIQSYGCMLVIDKRTNLFVACSDNVESFLEKSPDQVMGLPSSAIFKPECLTSLSALPAIRDRVISHVINAEIAGKLMTVSNHSAGSYCIVEIEPLQSVKPFHSAGQKTAFIQPLGQYKTPAESAHYLMQTVAELIEFDRVLLYKFLPEWHGEVIGEVLKPGVQGYLGLRFPASDLPANARHLYTVNLQRLIGNVSASTSTLLSQNDEVDLDLTWSQLRAVHPVHIQYLKNMGVEASFSLSIVCNGELWGMLACHNLSPKIISMPLRQTCEELSCITTLHMSGLLRTENNFRRFEYLKKFSEIRGALHSYPNAYKAINSKITEIRELFNADGIWHRLNGQDYYSGEVPDDASIRQLETWLGQFDKNQVMASHEISKDLVHMKSLVKLASGVMYLPFNQQDFLVFLRHEEIETVNWAGKSASKGDDDFSVEALMPRHSFQTWTDVMRGQSRPWDSIETIIAEMVRSELVELIEKYNLEDLALKDPLTGIANRMMFERKINKEIQHALDEDKQSAVYMIDLDNFKAVNDSCGHAAGDELLIKVSQRLTGLLRNEDVVARLGGDEFAVIQTEVKSKSDVDRVASRMVDEMKRQFTIGDKNIEIGASVGIALCPNDAVNQAGLMLGADLALYEVKKSGRNGYKYFEKSMMLDKAHAETTRNKLLEAFEQAEIKMVYQPIIDVRSGQIAGLEAFARWHHPEKGLLLAKEFISQIEQHNLNSVFVEWGLKTVFKHYQHWQSQEIVLFPVSINMRSDQFLSFDIENTCRALGEELQTGTSWLRIDLNEAGLLMDARRVEAKIIALAHMGVLCNIDHFGQGLLSPRQFSRLKVNTLKIDGRLLRSGDEDNQTEALLTILKAVSSAMNVPVVAAQLENAEMLERAAASGFNLVQGFAVCEPFFMDELADRLNKFRTEPEESPGHINGGIHKLALKHRNYGR